MRFLLPFFILFLVLSPLPQLCGNAKAQKPIKSNHQDPKSSYEILNIEGWKVLVSKRYKDEVALKDRVLEEVRVQLRRIAMLVNPKPLKELRKVEIWVEKDYPNRCQYHTSQGWLINNGYIKEKAGTVEIASAKALLVWQRRPVLTLLHELAHAYHDKVLGWNEPRIKKAFESYQKSGAGKRVIQDTGNYARHYALSDHKEYFAEMTEAYLWVNDYYPFVFGELKTVDPEMVKILQTIWGKRR